MYTEPVGGSEVADGVVGNTGWVPLPGMRTMVKNFAWIAALIVGAAGSVRADVIDFQNLASSSTPLWFDGTLDSPLTITTASDVVTFKGGELLNDQAGQFGADQTVVYASENLPGLPPPYNYPGVYANPITVNFKTAVNGFSVQITNEINNTYQITDNLGHSSTLYIPLDTTATLTLADSGITWVNISSLPTSGAWEYAVDNISFNGSSRGVPEPSTTTLLLMSLGGIALVAARKRKVA